MKKISLFLLIALLAMPFSMKADYNVSSTATWKTIKIVLDPGHGGSDPGASGPSAPHEATLCLAAAKQVRTWLYALGASSSNVKMTRTTDVYVGLSARKNYTSTYNSDIFSSFHLNAFNGTAKGTETYYTNKSGATSSSKLASRVQSQLIAKLGLTNRGVKTANYTVIGNGVTYPSILTEGLFVDNKSEWSIIKDYKTPSNGFLNWCRAHIIGYYNYLKNDKGCTKFTNPTTVTGTASGGSSSGGSTTPDTPSTPSASLTATASGSTTLTGKMKMSNPPSFTIKVVGSGLSNEISYNPSNSAVKVEANSGWNTTTGGTLTVTLNPDYSQGAGTYEGYVAIQSTSSYRKEVAFKVTLAEADGSANVDQGDKSEGGVQGQTVTTKSESGKISITHPYLPHLDGVIGTAAKANSRAAGSSFEIQVAASTDDVISVNSSSSCVLLSTKELPKTGGTITVTPNPAFVLGAGEYSATIALQQGNESLGNRVTMECTVTLAPDGTFTADVDKLVLPALTLESDSKQSLGSVTYLGGGLTEDIAVSISGEGFYINDTKADGSENLVTSVTVPAKGGTIEIAYTATTAGEFSTNLVAKSGATTLTIPVSVSVRNEVAYNDITTLTEGWLYSTNKGNLADATWFSTNADVPTRDMCYADGKLYVLTVKLYGEATVNIINAFDGTSKSTLNCTGASLSGIKSLGNTIVGCSYSAKGDGALNIYKWSSDAAAPEVWLSTTNHGGIEVGRSFNTYGTMEDGVIAFGGIKAATATEEACNVLVYYEVSNGTINSTPVVVNFGKGGGNTSNQSIVVLPDGSFWCNNKDNFPVHYNADGSVKTTLAPSVGKQYGTAIKTFDYGHNKYVAYTATLGSTESSAWGNAVLQLVNVTDEANPVYLGSYPSDGLGIAKGWAATVTNQYYSSGTNAVDYYVDEATGKLYIWVLVPYQGVAMYKHDNATSGIEDVEVEEVVDENAPVEYYNLQGVRVEGEYLNPGIYIRRQGNSVSKVLVK